MTLKIRKTTIKDIPEVMAVYADGHEIMRESGNPTQWASTYPSQDIVEQDIKHGKSYVCVGDDDVILAVFFFCTEPDPTYTKIDGAWISDTPYGTIHRIARKLVPEAKGAGAFCINWCYEQIPNVRIDTHEDNAPMLKLLKNLGFIHCGTIWIDNGEPRLAFQRWI